MVALELRNITDHAASRPTSGYLDASEIVTPKGVLQPARCYASATREGH